MRHQTLSASRARNWRRVYRVLASERLLSSLDVSSTGQIWHHEISWEDYWSQLAVPPQLEPHLDTLRFARAGYIRSGFELRLASPYCYAYFTVLRRALDGIEDGLSDSRLLAAILGFENTAVHALEGRMTVAAVTSTARNPVYLLSKIYSPTAWVDSKFLPIVTHSDPTRTTGSACPLFFHYRQLASGRDGQDRLLIFPVVAMEGRVAAFRCLRTLSDAFSNKRDTHADQRATRIAALAVGPILHSLMSNGTIASGEDIRVADLGSGSGDLTRHLITSLAERYPALLEGHRFSWTPVDVSLSNMQRHAYDRRFSRWISVLRCERSDYIRWIERQRLSGVHKPFHLVLACRLLNNASLFTIGCASDWQEIRPLVGKSLEYHEWAQGAHLPNVALRCGTLGSRSLIVSNTRVSLPEGSSYRQASLSDYYQGLRVLMGCHKVVVKSHQRPVFFPIRRFNEAAVVLPSGETLMERLCSLSNAVIIEDVDLDAATLRQLLQSRGLGKLTASDATDRSRMHTASLLCVAEKREKLTLPGRRIW